MSFVLCPFRPKNTIRRKYTYLSDTEEPITDSFLQDKILEIETVEYMPCEFEKCPFYDRVNRVCRKVEHEVNNKHE